MDGATSFWTVFLTFRAFNVCIYKKKRSYSEVFHMRKEKKEGNLTKQLHLGDLVGIH